MYGCVCVFFLVCLVPNPAFCARGAFWMRVDEGRLGLGEFFCGWFGGRDGHGVYSFLMPLCVCVCV